MVGLGRRTAWLVGSFLHTSCGPPQGRPGRANLRATKRLKRHRKWCGGGKKKKMGDVCVKPPTQHGISTIRPSFSPSSTLGILSPIISVVICPTSSLQESFNQHRRLLDNQHASTRTCPALTRNAARVVQTVYSKQEVSQPARYAVWRTPTTLPKPSPPRTHPSKHPIWEVQKAVGPS